jgi:hypothetical protein
LEKQVEQLLSAAQHDVRGASRSPRRGSTAAPQPSIGTSDGAPATPRTTEADSTHARSHNRDDPGTRDRSVDIARDTEERPRTVERMIGPSLEPETTTRRVIEGVEVSPAQGASLFRL